MKGDKEMSPILDHRELKIKLPAGFVLELKGESVLLKKQDGLVLDVVPYGELTQRKRELERLAHQYKN